MSTFVGFPQSGHSFSASEVGLALAGLIVRDGDVPKVGFLGVGPTVAAVAASWKVEVGRCVYVHQVAGAVQFSGVSSPEQVDIAPSTGIPAGQARIDLVVWNPNTASLLVVQGTPAVSPVVPSSGSVPVARVLVASGDGMVVAGQVSPVFVTTSVVGADPVAQSYSPVVSGYESGWAPDLEASFIQVGKLVEVEVRGITDRVMSRLVSTLFVSVPVPMPVSPISVEGGGFFLIGPSGARQIYDLRVRQGSATQVVLEMVRVSGGNVARVSPLAGGFAAADLMSWRCRFSYTAA